jgi:hypothetical protein
MKIAAPVEAHKASSATVSATQQYTTLRHESGKQAKGGLEQAYDGFFLTLPAPVVLAILWLGGVTLMSICGVALYLTWLLLQALVGG